MSFWNLIFNRKKYKKPATISLSNIKGFLQGNLRSFRNDMDGLELDSHIREQSIWRLKEISKKSPGCLKGDCLICGCDTYSKVFEDRECKADDPCYPIMMDKEEWGNYKKTNNIIIDEIQRN